MIDIADQGAMRIITLARPDKANALTRDMLVNIKNAFAAPPEIACVVLTGEGRAFSAGADLEAARAGLATDSIWQELFVQISTSPCLTIAALNGTVAGGAFGMVLACDLRLSVPEAKFFYPVMRLGYLPQPHDPARLAALIGTARAKMILLGGAKIDAAEALAWGLIERIVPQDALISAAQELAHDASGASRAHLAAIKAMI